MTGFGDKLRREREMRGVSLEEISESTKISTRNLRALEEDDFDRLPGGIFNKGFVRAYSRFLGLDEEQTVTDFEAAYKEYMLSKAPVQDVATEEEPEPSSSKSLWLTTVAVIVIAALVAAGYLLSHPGILTRSSVAPTLPAEVEKPQTEAPAPSNTQPGSASDTLRADTQSAATSTAAPETKPSQPNGPSRPNASAHEPEAPTQTKQASASVPVKPESASAIRLRVFAKEESWLAVSADGKDLGQGTLAPLHSRTITAQKEVRLKVGNLGGVEVSFNGKPVNIDGEPKQVKELTFTPDGLRQ